jgi:hypothetical protein
MHRVTFSIPERILAYSDIVFAVHRGPDKAGELRVSQGGVDWRRGRAKRWKKLSWERFNRILDAA